MILLVLTAYAEEGPARESGLITGLGTATVGSAEASEGSTSGTADIGEVPALYTDHATTSPAATLLSSGATEIQRPGTPGDLVVALGEGLESRSVSIETAPYWLAAPPGLSLEEHIAGGLPTLWRNASVSLAVSEGDATDDGTPLNVATGGRLTLWGAPREGTPQAVFLDALRTGTLPDDAPAAANACLVLLSDLAGLADTYGEQRAAMEQSRLDEQVGLQLKKRELERSLKSLQDGEGAAPREQVQDLKARIALLERQIGQIDDSLDEAEEELWESVVQTWESSSANDKATCAAIIQARQGLSVDVAGGAAFSSADSSVSGVRLVGFTGWVAPGWVFEGQKTSLVGLLRIAGTGADTDLAVTVDSGARLIHAWQRYAISGEGGYRAAVSNAEGSVWTSATLDLRVQEGVWLSGTLGLTTPLDAPASLISGLNLTVDFSDDRSVVPSTSPPIPDTL